MGRRPTEQVVIEIERGVRVADVRRNAARRGILSSVVTMDIVSTGLPRAMYFFASNPLCVA